MNGQETRELFIGHLPGRKRPAMWAEASGAVRPLAYFCGDAEYEAFKEMTSGRGLRQVPPTWEDEE